jgi:hypothetical protein
MCEPTTILAISAGLAATQAVVQHNAGVVAYNRQADAIANNQQAIAENYAAEQMSLQRASGQVQEQAADQMSERALETRRQLAFIQTVAAEYGGGNSADRLAHESVFNAGRDLTTIGLNRDNSLAEIGFNSQAAARGARNQMRSQSDSLGSPPSTAGTLLKIGSTGLDIYSRYQAINTPKPGK